MSNTASKAAAALAALLTASTFAAIGLLAVNAVGTDENGTASANNIKFYAAQEGAPAAEGYDVVAYFSESRAVKGLPEYETEWGGIVWRFSTPENRAAFLETPAKYVPQYGGHCAFGAAGNYLVRGDPLAWTVREDKLYLNYNYNIRTAWLADAAALIQKADANWPKLNT